MKFQHNNITVEAYRQGKAFVIRVREVLPRTERVDVEYVYPEDAREIFEAVCRRIAAGVRCPVWCFADYYDKHAELFY